MAKNDGDAMTRNCDHAHCTLCGKCLTCDPHPAHSK
jgi:hypothetical protein